LNIKPDYKEKITDLKRNVREMLEARAGRADGTAHGNPASTWTQSIRALDYLMNLSEEDFLNIRVHTGPINGEPVFSFWHKDQPFDPPKFAEAVGYKFQTEGIPEAYWLSEPPAPGIPGPMGVTWKGKVVNHDIARYQSCVTNLYEMGVLRELSANKTKNLVLEVGGGYGGLAHHLGRILAANSTYVIMDLPEMLLFAGAYLIVNNPDKDIYVYEESTFGHGFLSGGVYDYDYVLLPNYVLKDLYSLPEINLMVNMLSFQEMTREQVGEYLEFGRKKLSGCLYSSNYDIPPKGALHPDTVSTLLSEYFDLFPPPGFYEKYMTDIRDWTSYLLLLAGRSARRLLRR
jgi:hypothetical protein